MKRFLLLVCVLVVPLVGSATTRTITTTISETVAADDATQGECAAKLVASLTNRGLDCNRFVTFSCDGTFHSKDVANRMFESAQVAQALGFRVRARVDDTRKAGGYCLVVRLSVLP